MTIKSLPALLFLGLCACSGSTDNLHSIAVSFEPQADVVRQIAGDSHDVIVLVSPSTDPESYDPSMAELVSLQNSDIYFTLSTPGFEQAVLPRIAENFPNLDVINVAEDLPMVEGTHGPGEGDPHIWSSARNMVILSKRMTDALAKAYPGDAEAYRERCEKVVDRLTAFDDSLSNVLAPLRGKSFLVIHPSLTYFARDYGLHQIALETEGKESSPAQLQQRLDSAKACGALVVVAEKGHHPAQAAQAAKALGVPVVELQLNSAQWPQELAKLATALREAHSK